MKKSCKIKSAELREFAFNQVYANTAQKLPEHIKECPDCQFELWNIFKKDSQGADLTNDEIERLKKMISRLVEKSFREKEKSKKWLILEKLIDFTPIALAAADGQTADNKLNKLALGEQRFSFVAMCNKNNENFWRAEMVIPSQVTGETILSIRLVDSKGERIKSGVLNFCGIDRIIENGKCYLPILELRGNLKKQSISFRKTNGTEMAGSLELFPEEFKNM